MCTQSNIVSSMMMLYISNVLLSTIGTVLLRRLAVYPTVAACNNFFILTCYSTYDQRTSQQRSERSVVNHRNVYVTILRFPTTNIYL